MKLLFDQNISFRITKKLIDLFPDCKHLSDCGLMDCEDPDIWKYAKNHDYSIVTFDSDFYDISLISGHPPKIIWFRTGNLTTNEIVQLLDRKKEIIERFLDHDAYLDISCLELEV